MYMSDFKGGQILIRTRHEIMPDVWLTALETDKFKTELMSISLLTNLDRDTASLNAITPYVLARGSSVHPDMESISAACDELYGTIISPFVRRYGEIQATGFFMNSVDGRNIPNSKHTLEKSADLMAEILLSPLTRAGLLTSDYVESEKEKLIDKINAQKNNKGSWAVTRLIENMCAYENYAVSRYGDESAVEDINYKKLSKHYRELISTAPIEIFYCGSATSARVIGTLRRALSALPRGEINYDIGTEIRLNSLEENPRFFNEKLDIGQGKLTIGFRLGDCMEDPDYAAIRVFNAIFGGSVTSKLFENVREKLSLCYYASSMVELHKGLLIVSSGIAFDKFEATKEEIFNQLEEIKRGNVTEDELLSAKKGLASDLRSLADDPMALESYWSSQILFGDECSPEELAVLCESVKLSEVVEIANSVECDAIYFLSGLEAEDE